MMSNLITLSPFYIKININILQITISIFRIALRYILSYIKQIFFIANSMHRFHIIRVIFTLILSITVITYLIYRLNNIFNMLILLPYEVNLFIFSFIIHLILLNLIKLNIFGVKVKQTVIKLITSKINIITLYYFIAILIIITLIKYNINIIYLEEVTVQTKFGKVDVTIKGDVIKYIFNNFGDVAVFTFGARLASVIISKHSMAPLTKIGVSITSGASSLATYNSISMALPENVYQKDSPLTATISLNDVNLTVKSNYELPDHPFLDVFLGTNPTLAFDKSQFELKSFNGNTFLTSNLDLAHSPILYSAPKERVMPDWNNSVIDLTPVANRFFIAQSPLEKPETLISFLIEGLTYHFIINFTTIYLLITLTIIFICKFILRKNMEFKFLTKLSIFKWQIGVKINKLLNWYISMWQKSSNVWIFFILIVLIVTNTGSLYSLTRILKFLNEIYNNIK